MYSELSAMAAEMRERELILIASQLRVSRVKERLVQGHRRLTGPDTSLECGLDELG